MKVFISQPMNGKTTEQIERERNKAIKRVKDLLGNVEIIDSYIKIEEQPKLPVEYLAKAIQLLSQADVAVFIGDWENARGCRIEKQICEEYNIKNITLQEKPKKKHRYDDGYHVYYERWFL